MQILFAQTPATQAPASTFAQYVVDSTLVRHLELLELDAHSTSPGSTQSEIIAAKSTDPDRHKSDPEELEVANTGLRRVEVEALLGCETDAAKREFSDGKFKRRSG